MSLSEKITINIHSSIRVASEKIIYFDPIKITEKACDADIIFITHDHFDHFEKESIDNISKEGTTIVIPKTCEKTAKEAGYLNIITVEPGEKFSVCGYDAEAIPAYNIGKDFHKKEYGWVGYAVNIDGEIVYVCGDTDDTPDGRKVKCDILLLPVSGTYTMSADEGAAFADALSPKLAIPTHYGDSAGTANDGKTFLNKTHCKVEIKIK